MSKWSRIALGVLWALTLVFAAQRGASARQQPAPQGVISGADIGFRIEGAIKGAPYGTLMIRQNGQWLAVTRAPGGVMPLVGQ